ncbi:MAG: nucleotidyl transferase AbiEii/AbiGii toxin family protein [Candidatus Thermoplasmatota archaeon]|nr:nucleotidyl transferase AbiEii/AbiGii toxin family protein [Candidatus Thermoplasmatota archaeon]
MISPTDLLVYKPRFMDGRQLEKDYLQHLLLYEFYLDFSFELVFKGGTALKMLYGLDRFSEDLDFTLTREKNRTDTIRRFETTLKRLNASYTVVSMKRRGTKTSLDLELKINGPLYESEKRPQNIEINLSMREEMLAEPEFKTISPIYQDIPLFSLYSMRSEEIFAEKVRALLTRKRVKARDVYDLYFLMKYKNVNPRTDLINAKLKPYSVDFSKELLKDRIESIGHGSWKSELSNILRTVPDYDLLSKYLLENFVKNS